MDEIVLVDYDPTWSEKFEQEAAWIRSHLPPDLVLAIEHVGSTAIPGLTAKPIIDIVLIVSSLEAAIKEAVPILESQGYSYWAANPDRTRLFLVKGLPPNGPRTFHIHATEPGHINEEKILFRDFLRKNTDAAQQYARLKQDLAIQFAEDREAYTDSKAEFVQSILKQARANQGA